MATEELLDHPDAEPELEEVGADAEDQEAAGEDLGKWNERLDEDLQSTLKKMAEFACNEYIYPRRLQVMQAWKARSFWREMQHLKWNWDGQAWECLGGPGLTRDGTSAPEQDSAIAYSTNVYQGFGDSFIAIITQAIPSLRWEPEDMDEAADVEAAEEADPARRIIQHWNDPIKLLTKIAYLSWTDGLIAVWSRWETDRRTQKPRVFQTAFGSMEVKVPMIDDEEEEYLYLQFSKEYSASQVRAKVKARDFDNDDEGAASPNPYWKKISGGSSGNGQDMYERTARISVKQGISLRSAGGDAYAHLVTTQRTWFRSPDAFYMDCVEESKRESLISLFPHGCYVEFDNGVYTGSRDASMDDEWAVENVMEGDGAFRNAKGTCLISVQERGNDIINITQDVYEKTIPATWYDQEIFDIDAMKSQRAVPGAKYGYDGKKLTQAGDAIGNHVWSEPAAVVSADMLQYLKELMTDIPQFLTGIAAILFGSDTGGDKSGKALSVQQNMAMGRVGLPFRVIKRLYAKAMEQAVRCAARHSTSDLKAGIPDENGEIESITARIEGLSGNVRCVPDTDENQPLTWSAKQGRYMQLMTEAGTDPTMKATLALPKNQELGKKLIGLPELEVEGADSYNKQMREINYLLKTPFIPAKPVTVPNPQDPLQQIPVPNPANPAQPLMTPEQPSIKPQQFDNNQMEFQACVDWLNSPKGIKAFTKNPKGYHNVELHAAAHQQIIQQQQAQAQQAAMAQQLLAAAAKAPKQAPPKKPKAGAAPAPGAAAA